MSAEFGSRCKTSSKTHQAPEHRVACSLFDERLIRVTDVPRFLPRKSNGKYLGVSTVYRWMQRGSGGVVLESMQAPFGRITSIEAVERFLLRLNRGTVRIARPNRLHRRREAVAAERYVRAALGITHAAEGEVAND